jgi:hypothetical protein
MAEESYTFYFVTHGVVGDPWWSPVIQGAQDAAELLGVTVHYVGLEKWDLMLLKSNLEAAILAEPDGIILTITSYEPFLFTGVVGKEQRASVQVWVIMPESPEKGGTLWVKSLPCFAPPSTGPSASRQDKSA